MEVTIINEQRSMIEFADALEMPGSEKSTGKIDIVEHIQTSVTKSVLVVFSNGEEDKKNKLISVLGMINKGLFTLILALAAVSCSKEKRAERDGLVCWECSVVSFPTGGNSVIKEACLPEGERPRFYDQQGNMPENWCRKK